MRRLAPVLACVALLAACGGDESIDPEADEERIEDALLTLDDLPDGFAEGESSDDDSQNECNQDVLDIDADAIDENQTAETEQVSFEDDTTQVQAKIEAFRDTDIPERVLDAIADDDEYLDCLEDAIVEQLEGELTSFEEIDTADGGRAIELRATVTGAEGELEVVSQQHAVLVDRFGVTLQVTSVGGEVDEDLVEEALDTMIEGLEEGEG